MKMSLKDKIRKITKEKKKDGNLFGDNTKRFEDKFWKIKKDPKKPTAAIIRILPDKEGEYFTTVYSYYFSVFSRKFNKDLWYIEKSPTTLGLEDPVSELFFKWRNGTEAQSLFSKRLNRSIERICNILVIKDPADPTNNGRVFQYKCPKYVFNLIKNLETPTVEDIALGQEPVDVLDIIEGRNIKLKIEMDNSYWKYDGSIIDNNATAIADDDDKIEEILNQTTLLRSFKEPSVFKSYPELEKRLIKILAQGEIDDNHPFILNDIIDLEPDDIPSVLLSKLNNNSGIIKDSMTSDDDIDEEVEKIETSVKKVDEEEPEKPEKSEKPLSDKNVQSDISNDDIDALLDELDDI